MNIFTRPGMLLRIEGFIALAAGCLAYQRLFPGHWGLFAALFLVPDVSLVGYMISANRVSAAVYNAVHSYLFRLILAPFASQYALIWLCHISWDRLVGYGLKYPGTFKQTHIQNADRIPAVVESALELISQ